MIAHIQMERLFCRLCRLYTFFFRNRLLNLQLDGEINRFILYVESCLIHEFNLKFNWKRKVTSIQQFKPNRKFQTPPETTPASSKKGILTCI